MTMSRLTVDSFEGCEMDGKIVQGLEKRSIVRSEKQKA